MKRIFLLLAGVVIVFTSLGQSIDYNKVILPESIKDVTIEERLVQLVWSNHPSRFIAVNNVEMSDYQLKKAKWSWLNHINMVGNLNEFTIRGRDENDPLARNNMFPRYNFGIGISLGTFASTPLNIKIAREALQNDEESIKLLKLKIRADVLKRYHQFRTDQELYAIQREYFGDLEANFKLVETKFRNGESSLNDYNAIRDRYDTQRMRTITSENAYLQSKIELEELLGMRIEDLL